MLLSNNMKHEQNQATSQAQLLLRAEKILLSLQKFDLVTDKIILSGLKKMSSLLKTLEQGNEQILTAIEKTRLALLIPFSDPSLEMWSSWTGRSHWLAEELTLLKTQVAQPKTGLLQLRRYYDSDDEGCPVDIDLIAKRSKEIREVAHDRFALYLLQESVDRYDQGLIQKQDMLFEARSICAGILDERSFLVFDVALRNIQSELKSARPIYALALKALLTSDSSRRYKALAHCDDETLDTILASLKVRIYSDAKDIPLQFLDMHDQLTLEWQRISPSYEDFSRHELITILAQPGSYLTVLSFGEETIHYGITLVGRDDFLPQTKEKLDTLNDIVLPSRFDVDVWEYYTSGNPHTKLALRSYGIDWYRLYLEVVSDLLIVKGKERLLAIVDVNNPAFKSHRRIGLEPLPTARTFPTDHGGIGKIISESPFSPDDY
jgi:hypothetical protein